MHASLLIAKTRQCPAHLTNQNCSSQNAALTLSKSTGYITECSCNPTISQTALPHPSSIPPTYRYPCKSTRKHIPTEAIVGRKGFVAGETGIELACTAHRGFQRNIQKDAPRELAGRRPPEPASKGQWHNSSGIDPPEKKKTRCMTGCAPKSAEENSSAEKATYSYSCSSGVAMELR